MKSISETHGTIGEKNNKKSSKKVLEKDIKSTLLIAARLMKEVMNSTSSKKSSLCLDLKRSLEDIEKEYGTSLI